MLGLGIDTTGSSCAVALWADDKLKYSLAKNMNRGYAEVLMPMVDQALLETGLAYKNIDVVGVATGPGSFTGLRVGLSCDVEASFDLFTAPVHLLFGFWDASRDGRPD